MKCPRCGADFNDEYSELEVHFVTDEKWLTRLLSMHAGPQYDYRDRVHLCPNCVAAFKHWWWDFTQDTGKNIAYLCDRKACKECHPEYCDHTTDINHAVHFSRHLMNRKPRYIEEESNDVY